MNTRIRKSALLGAIILGALALPAGAAFASPALSQTSSPSATTTETATTATGTATTTGTTSPTRTPPASETATSTPTMAMTPTPAPSPTASASATKSPTATATSAVETPAPGGDTQPADAPFSATLTGAAQAPPVQTSDTGRFLATQEGLGIVFTLTAHGTGLTMAHIHSGAAGTNGPVAVTLYMATNPNGVSDINLSGAITPAMLQGAYAGKFQQFVDDLEAGKLYVNVHSVDYPDGVIRGQVQYAAPTPPNAPNTGNGTMTTNDSPIPWIVVGGGAAILAIGALGGWMVFRRQA